MKRDEQKTERDAVDDAWERATQTFANAKAMRPRLSWLTGVSIDTTANRIQRLLHQRRAAALHGVLESLDAAALRQFLQRTEINRERAAAAMRLNLVVNISAPIGALVIANQLFPEFVPNLVTQFGMDTAIAGSAAVLFLLLFSMWYCYSGVMQARDLAHLTRLYIAGRLDAAAAASDYDDAPLDPAELA